MEKKFLKEQMMRIETNYGKDRFQITKQMFDLWYEMFQNLDENGIKASVDEYIRTNEYPPTVASIIKIYNGKSDYREQMAERLWKKYKFICRWLEEKPDNAVYRNYVKTVMAFPADERNEIASEMIERAVFLYNDTDDRKLPPEARLRFSDVLGEYEWMLKNRS